MNLIERYLSLIVQPISRSHSSGHQPIQTIINYFMKCRTALFLVGMLPATVFAQNWKLVQPVYPTTDVVISAFSVADYGATGDGVTDVTSIFQDRLNALGELGGGTLFVPSGKYVIRGTLLIPKGITLRGEWQAPVKGQPITGTILMAYAGRGNEDTTAFISMQPSAAVRDVAIWYPEQLPDNIIPYSPAIVFGTPNYFGNDFCNAKDITFVNAYDGIKFSTANGGSCPVIFNVYGTPLNKGIEIDNIADVGRLEQIGFSPAYWAGSGLANAPAAGGSYASFINQNGTGIMMRRNDWTNTSFVNIEGYNVGFRAALSQTSPGAIPNGHNYSMTFTNCNTAVYFDGLSGVGIMFTQVTAANCANGFVVGPNAGNGTVQLHTCTIAASGNAISIDSTSTGTFLMEHTTISSGRVNIAGSTFTASDCDFNNGGPQVTIGKHARSLLTGNRFKGGTKIQNNSLYVNTIDSLPLTLTQLPSFPTITAESHMPSRLVLYVATSAPYNAKADGTTDNTTAIQSALNQASADGGGIVFLPPGKYKVSGDLSIPANVELKGSADNSTAPTGPGSTLEVYADRGNAAGTPFLRLAAGSGVRGLTIDYPDQNNSVIPNFAVYPYAIQALGANVYIVNIGIRACYNGIDLFTNKCDNHYVDFLAGQVFHNAIRVGGGSAGGKIYNLHFNTIYYANGSESKFGSWPNSPTSDGDSRVYDYDYNNVDFLELGNCSGEILYNDFVYGAVHGLRLLSDGAGPSGTSVGLGIDGTRQSVNFEGVMGSGGFNFINSQIVSLGDSGNNYIVTNPGFTGQSTFYSADYWGNPYNGLTMNGGTINQQVADFSQPGQQHWGNIQAGALSIHNSLVQPTNSIVNTGAESHLSARSSIIDSSNIIRANTALWQDNMGNSWQVSTAGAMDRHGWTATASLNNGVAQNALDSTASTRWTTGASQAPGQYFMVDMKTVNTIHEIVLDATQSPGDSPVGYGTYVSTDSIHWTGPIASGAGAPGMTLILFSDQVARYIKIVQTGSQGNWWSIHEFYVWGKVNVSGISITPVIKSLPADSTKQLAAVILPVNATNKAIAWSSGNPSVATVDSSGLVKAIGIGTAIIQVVSLDGGLAALDTLSITGAPFGGSAANIPGKIEAENYDNGGQGVAYNDADAVNNGGQYRPTEGVDIEVCGEGGYDVGWTAAGEWMNYTVNVNTAGVYTLQARVSSPNNGSHFHVELDGVNISGTINVPNTGSWQTYQTVSVTTPGLAAGMKVMRIVIETAGFNINYISFVQAGSSAGMVTTNKTVALAASPVAVNNAEADMLVYPNPVTGSQVNLQFVNQAAGKVHLRLINYANQPVYSTDISISGSPYFYSLSLNRNLSPGTYLLEAIDATGGRMVKKIVITQRL